MTGEKIRLKLDWDDVFPGDELKIGENKITIYPLGLRKLSDIMKKIRGISGELEEVGITFENYRQKKNLLNLVTTILDNCPEIISEASNIHQDDIDRLPIDVQVKVVDAVIKVNLKSKEALEKNLLSLEGTIDKIENMVVKK